MKNLAIALPILLFECIAFSQEPAAKRSQVSTTGELPASDPCGGIPMLISVLSVDDVRHLVASGITMRDLVCKIGSVPVISSGHATHWLKDGSVRMSIYSPANEIANSGSVVSTLKKTAEQTSAGQPSTRPQSKSEGNDKPQPEKEVAPR